MSKTFTGTVKSIGPEELGQTGNPKPRKLKISDDPNRDGLTFKIWGNHEGWSHLTLGSQVSVSYDEEPKEWNGRSWTDRMILSVTPADAPAQPQNGWATASAAQSEWSTQQQPQQAPAPQQGPGQGAQPPALDAPVSRDDYWERKEALDHQRSLEMEAAWAVKAVLDRSQGQELKHSEVVAKALDLIVVKRQVAHEMSQQA